VITRRHGGDGADPLADLLDAWRSELDAATERYTPEFVPHGAEPTDPAPAADPLPHDVRPLHGAGGRWRRRSVTLAIAAGVFVGSTGVAAAVVHPGGPLGLLRAPFRHGAPASSDADTARAARLLRDAGERIAAARAAGGIPAGDRRDVTARLDQVPALLGDHGPAALRDRLDELRRQLGALPVLTPAGSAAPGGPADPAATGTPAARPGDGRGAGPAPGGQPGAGTDDAGTDDAGTTGDSGDSGDSGDDRPGAPDAPRPAPADGGGDDHGTPDNPEPADRAGGGQAGSEQAGGDRRRAPQPAPSPTDD
jgi:hypothetical protein